MTYIFFFVSFRFVVVSFLCRVVNNEMMTVVKRFDVRKVLVLDSISILIHIVVKHWREFLCNGKESNFPNNIIVIR